MKVKGLIKYFVAVLSAFGLFMIFTSDPVYLNQVRSDYSMVGLGAEPIPEEFNLDYPFWDPGRTILYILLFTALVIAIRKIIKSSSVEQ